MRRTTWGCRLAFIVGCLGWTIEALTAGTASVHAGHPSEYRAPVEVVQQIPRKWRKVMETGQTSVLTREVRLPLQGIGSTDVPEFALLIPAGTRLRLELEGYGKGMGIGKVSTRQIELSPCVPVDYPAGALNAGTPKAIEQKVRIFLQPNPKNPNEACRFRIEFTELGTQTSPELEALLEALKPAESIRKDSAEVSSGRSLKPSLPAPLPSSRVDGETPAASGRGAE